MAKSVAIFTKRRKNPATFVHRLFAALCLLDDNSFDEYLMTDKPKLKRECWAKAVGGCDGGISREHVISDNMFDEDFGLFLKSGSCEKLKWSSLSIKYLCRKHNSRLAPFDAEAGKFIKALRYLLIGHTHLDVDVENDGTSELVRINGNYLEKWFGKTLLNFAVFKGVRGDFEFPACDINTSHIIGYLYENQKLENQYGLYQLKFGTNLLDTTQPVTFQVSSSKFMRKRAKVGKEQWFSLPGFLYAKIFGVELIGNFNISLLNNKLRDDIVIGENFSKFSHLSKAIKNPVELGYAAPHLGDKSTSTIPPRRILIEWK